MVCLHISFFRSLARDDAKLHWSHLSHLQSHMPGSQTAASSSAWFVSECFDVVRMCDRNITHPKLWC